MARGDEILFIRTDDPHYQTRVRISRSTDPNGVDTIVCTGTLCDSSGRPVAAAKQSQRTVHRAEDIAGACQQLTHAAHKWLARKEGGGTPKTAAVDNPLAERVRRIRADGQEVYPKQGSRGWIRRTQDSYLAIFASQVAPRLSEYIGGTKSLLPSDLDALLENLKADKAASRRSNGRQADLIASAYADLTAAAKIYDFIQQAYPDLQLPVLNLAPPPRRGIGARREQEKSLPESVRQAIFRYVDGHWQQHPRYCYALTLMLGAGLRTAEAAGTRPSQIRYTATYGCVLVCGQEKKGVVDPILKYEDSYRTVVMGCWACDIINRCTQKLVEDDPDWAADEKAPVCQAAGLSAWILALLYTCGIEEAYMAAARRDYEQDITYGKDGCPLEDLSAYLLRRDWASRARNICGYTSVELDLQLGHKVKIPKAKRPNLKLTQEQVRLAQKAERYVYSTTVTRHPGHRAIPLMPGTRETMPSYGTVRCCNGSDTPIVVEVVYCTEENADAVQFTMPRGAMRRPTVISRQDDPAQRMHRPILGKQTGGEFE